METVSMHTQEKKILDSRVNFLDLRTCSIFDNSIWASGNKYQLNIYRFVYWKHM